MKQNEPLKNATKKALAAHGILSATTLCGLILYGVQYISDGKIDLFGPLLIFIEATVFIVPLIFIILIIIILSCSFYHSTTILLFLVLCISWAFASAFDSIFSILILLPYSVVTIIVRKNLKSEGLI